MNLKDQIKKYEEMARVEKEAQQIPVPIEKFASLQNATTPVLDRNVDAQVRAGLASLKHASTWGEWGFGSQNSVLLFKGSSGTGKTTTARWIARHLRKPLISVTMGDIGGGNAGDTERGLKRVFETGVKEKAIIFFDECDALLWDREKAGPDSMWMLGVINYILQAIEKYPELVILATNFSHVLDKALLRRVTYTIQFDIPHYDTRRKLWVAKWPKWPLALPINEIANLAQLPLTGADIEKAIKAEARQSLSEKRKPSIESLKAILARANEAQSEKED